MERETKPTPDRTTALRDAAEASVVALLRERDALRAELDRANLDFDTVNDHLADCQEELLKHGTPAGVDGSVDVGIARLATERDEARRQRDVLLARVRARYSNCDCRAGMELPDEPAFDQQACVDCVNDRVALARAGSDS